MRSKTHGIWGVYIMQSIAMTERIYVGSTSDLKKRKAKHLFDLKNNKHHSPKLQRHYNKYGKDDLVFDILEIGEYFNTNHLLAREQGWFDHFCFDGSGLPYFNMLEKAGSSYTGHSGGWFVTEEKRKKLSIALRGNKNNFGSVYSEEARKKIGDACRGRKLTEEHKHKQRIAMLGKPKKPEAIRKTADAKRGKPRSDETKRKISEANKGRKRSDEFKQKLRDYQKRLRDEKETRVV